MAFVGALSLGVSSMRPSAHAVSSQKPHSNVATTVRMGYGDYQRFIKTDVSSSSGRQSAPIEVPVEGIAQAVDPLIRADTSNQPEDPRVTEALGKAFDWDGKVPQGAMDSSSFGDLDDPSTMDSSFAAFRRSSSTDRSKVLADMEAGRKHRLSKIQSGLSENYLLTMEGKLEANYAQIQKIGGVQGFSSSGAPQTDIPGKPYMRGIGALDFMKVGGREPNYKFWPALEAEEKDESPALPQS